MTTEPLEPKPDPWGLQRSRLAANGLARVVRPQLRDHPRIIIAGGPRAGKSTAARQLVAAHHRRFHHGEELVGIEWSAGSEKASRWFDEPGPWLCENVAMARALRKWLTRNPHGVPADLIIHMGGFCIEPLPGQARMAVGCRTVWNEIKPELMRRGAKIIESNP